MAGAVANVPKKSLSHVPSGPASLHPLFTKASTFGLGRHKIQSRRKNPPAKKKRKGGGDLVQRSNVCSVEKTWKCETEVKLDALLDIN